MAIEQRGLYLNPRGTFLSDDEIRRKNAPAVEMTPLPTVDRPLADWTKHLLNIQAMRKEILPLPTHIEITHKAKEPVFYALIGDIHAGGDEVDYQRINDEVNAIKHEPQAHVITLGDLTDNFFFNPASEGHLVNRGEQAIYAQKLLEELNGHLKVAVAGNHDLWSNQMGLSMYHDFVKKYQAHYAEGLVYVTLNVGDSKFNLALAHQFGGHSIYNSAHPEHRMQREAGDGVDIFVGGHTHRKAVNRQAIKGINGGRQALMISLGAYKASDGYSRKKGYPSLTPDEMGGVGIIFKPENKDCEVFWDIREGLKQFQKPLDK